MEVYSKASSSKPVILFDIMDTVVCDPFYQHVPKFFDLSFKELLQVKHPSMWILFEKGEVGETDVMRNFFLDGRAFDHQAFVNMMCENYEYINGMQSLLQKLKSSGAEMHAFSNYPEWYRKIEDKLSLGRYLQWTFVSCHGPMKGVRKPDSKAYNVVLDTLECLPSDVLLIDDREANVEAAKQVGFDGVLFTDASSLTTELKQRGWQL